MVESPVQKDYYSILQVHPKASMLQIKKAYRMLAFKFHPDSNDGGDALSISIFRDINEAYNILSSVEHRRAYDKKNYYTSAPTFYKNREEWLDRISFLKKYVNYTDPFRINRDGLCFCVQILLEPNYHNLLSDVFDDTTEKILDDILFIIKPLTYEQSKEITDSISQFFKMDVAQQTIKSFTDKKRKQEKWQNSTAYIATGIAILLCLLIFLFTQ